MLLHKISLKNFRNFSNSTFQFNPFLTIIIGENSRGKTNLLEAIYFITNGVGFRESKEEEFLPFDSRNDAIVEAIFMVKDDKISFSINLKKKDEKVEKIFQVNRTKKRHFEYIKNQPKTVLFSPEQIEIIIGPPDRRRDYLNRLIASYDWEYKKKLKNYEQALRRRNKILEIYSSPQKLSEELMFWNKYLEQQAAYITEKRAEYTAYLNQNQKIDSKEFKMKYIKSELTQNRLQENLDKEMRVKRTLIGPQKDDLEIYINGKNVHHFGSRSEQRLAVLWLKINELKFFETLFQSRPLFLLDDIFSELDKKNRQTVINLIQKYQTITTTTEIELLKLIAMPKSTIKL